MPRPIEPYIQSVKEYSKPDLLKVPKKNPTLVYRWIRNTPENIRKMELKGYKVADGEIVRQAGLTPSEDGTAKIGDLVLAVEEYRHHAEHKEAEKKFRELQKKQMERGLRRRVQKGGFTFEETISAENSKSESGGE